MLRAARVAGPIAGALALAIVATMHQPRVQAQASPSPSTTLRSPALSYALGSTSEHDRRRIQDSAREGIDRLTDWLGPCPTAAITIASQPWRDLASFAPSQVAIDVPWRSAPMTMDVESQVVFGLARQWWPTLTVDADSVAVADGLAWYLQSRIVDRLFDFSFLVPAHSATGVRYFGGAWPWTFQILPLGRWSGGLGRSEYLRAQRRPVEREPARRLPAPVTTAVLRNALAFATLEQLVGWPALQGALRAMTQHAAQRSMTRLEIEQVLATAVGQDLAWFFRLALDPSQQVDYAIAELTTGESAPCGHGPCFRTRVRVERKGAGQFTGSSDHASTTFDTGDAMQLRVDFAGGQQLTARWDGRASSRTFAFDSASAAIAAEIDPDHILQLDDDHLNDAIRTARDTPVRVRKWVAYWLVWLEGAVLDYGMLF